MRIFWARVPFLGKCHFAVMALVGVRKWVFSKKQAKGSSGLLASVFRNGHIKPDWKVRRITLMPTAVFILVFP